MSPLTESEILKLMVDTHGARFDGRIWDAFDEEVVPRLPEDANIVDLGCGPGLFLFDLYQRLPQSRLSGLDSSEMMLDVASNLSWGSPKPALKLYDLPERIPLESESMHLVAMNFFLHQFDYPLPVLAEVTRVLRMAGLIWIYDWARRPLEDYLQFWEVDPGLPGVKGDQSVAYRLFPAHNRFARDDWHYVIAQAGLKIIHEVTRAQGHHLLMILRRATSDAEQTR